MKLGEEMLYLSQTEVESLNISMQDVTKLMDVLFHEKGEGYTVLPPTTQTALLRFSIAPHSSRAATEETMLRLSRNSGVTTS